MGGPKYIWGVITNGQNDHHRVKYFCEALDFKYHLGYPWGVPRPPLPLTPLNPYRGVWGGGLNGVVDLMVLTPKCDIFVNWRYYTNTSID